MFSKIESIKSKMKNLFLSDDKIWIVTFSGGKDSTLLLQLTLEMFMSLDKKQRKPIYIVTNKVSVEIPIYEKYLNSKLDQIKNFVNQNKLQKYIKIYEIEPSLGFFTLLIGRGYPPPNKNFRYCTSYLKRKPLNEFLEKESKKHSFIILLGVRKDESENRKRSIEKRERNYKDLNKHEDLDNVYFLSPIKELLTSEVWYYLLNNKPVWGTHDDLFELYEKGSINDCSIKDDYKKDKCNTRYGCWICTVVNRDKSMEGLIKHGETWLKPLNEYRNLLKKFRDDPERRSSYKRTGVLGKGPFKMNTRKELLEKLLEIEKKINYELISDKEILKIQEEWQKDGDFNFSAIKIAQKYNRLKNVNTEYEFLDEDDLNEIKKMNIEPGLINQVLVLEQDAKKLLKRRNLLENIEKVFKSYIIKEKYY